MSDESIPPRATVQSVGRAFAILETFDEDHTTRSAAEIAELVGLARPTTYRMLQTLQQLGYVRHTRAGFEVSPRVLRLGGGYLGRRSLAARAQPLLDQLGEQLGEHIAIGVLDGDDVIAVATTTSPQSRLLSVAVHVGQRLPADRTSLGRVLLAAAGRLDPLECQQILSAGWAVSDGLLESGLRSIAVPIGDRRGTVVASLSTAVNASRITVADLEQRCLPAMLECAGHISHLT